MDQQIWRNVDGTAIYCTPCGCNKKVRTESGNVTWECTAENGVCVFLKKGPVHPEIYSDFHDVYGHKPLEVKSE